MERARSEYAAGAYATVVRTLQSSNRLLRDDPEAALLLSVSLFHINDLTEAKKNLVALIERKGNDFPVAQFYLGRVYHAQNLFPEAVDAYKQYLRTLNQEGEAWRAVTVLLKNVDNAIRLGAGDEQIIAENMGPAVNTIGDEFGPIPSPSADGRVYLTATRNGSGIDQENPDIFVTNVLNGTWNEPTVLNPLLNTSQVEYLVDISYDGSKIYYFRGNDLNDGQYLIDTFRAEADNKAVTLPVEVPFSSSFGDATPYFNSEDAIYFSSNRPDGYGGMDLYRRRRLPEGGYGPSENLGPTINGAYDEVCPFMARDNRTLYYSTNDPNLSIGGFDVVKAFRVVGGEGRFTVPENAGIPINSAGDDTHFRLAPDTYTAFLASDRKDGYGKRDVYVVYFTLPRLEME